MSQFVLTHDLRHLPPWLIFDVRQKNNALAMSSSARISISLLFCGISAPANTHTKGASMEFLRHTYDGRPAGPIIIRGAVRGEWPRNPLEPPYYNFQITAQGRIVDGELWMSESGACPVAMIRFPLPLKLRSDHEYTFIVPDVGSAHVLFLNRAQSPFDFWALRGELEYVSGRLLRGLPIPNT